MCIVLIVSKIFILIVQKVHLHLNDNSSTRITTDCCSSPDILWPVLLDLLLHTSQSPNHFQEQWLNPKLKDTIMERHILKYWIAFRDYLEDEINFFPLPTCVGQSTSGMDRNPTVVLISFFKDPAVNNKTIRHPKILGVYFYNMLTFIEYTKQINMNLRSQNNVLKALASSSWGKFKDILSTTYNAIARAVINYAAPILSPKLSEFNWRNLPKTGYYALSLEVTSWLMKIIFTRKRKYFQPKSTMHWLQIVTHERRPTRLDLESLVPSDKFS